MVNLFFALVGLVILLLIIQFLTLWRLRRLVKFVQSIITNKQYRALSSQKTPIQAICLQCKYRKAYIKAGFSGSEDDFYHYCTLHKKQVRPTDSCPYFQLDPEA